MTEPYAPAAPQASSGVQASALARPARWLQRRHPGHSVHNYRRASRAGLLAVALSVILLGASFALTDLDQDGLRAHEEWGSGASPWHRDTDNDGLADGWERSAGTAPDNPDTDRDGLDDAWELQRGYIPTHADPDGDGVDDLAESIFGTNPHHVDTDGDGIGDATEVQAAATDCDADNVASPLDPDDDSDGRFDGDEPSAQRCIPDTDADGVLDGYERAARCVVTIDCDEDGLADPDEINAGYDPLDPDTFEAKILDGVVYLFDQAGQTPSPDLDGDAIPDGWEDTEGIIRWDGFNPTPGVRDFLVEFVRVQGPDSSRYSFLDFTSSYQRVADFFAAESNVNMQWVETRITLDQESRPPLIPSSDSTYYANVLEKARFSANPYVSTVVMNPQHDQASVLHLGVAPIRGMLAGVDYGAHVKNQYKIGSNTVSLTPLWESVAQANRQDIITASGWQRGGIDAAGDVFLVADTFTLKWRAFWFATPPTVYPNDGSNTTALVQTGTTVDRPGLEHTILHELGHNLGLCHTELAACRANLTRADQLDAATSTMFSGSAPNLHFLPSQWEQIGRYLTCPPQPPLAALAKGADRTAVIASKYDYQLQDILNVQIRSCGDLTPIPDEFAPREAPAPYMTPAPDARVPIVRDSHAGPIAFVLLGAIAAASLAWVVAGWRLRRLSGPV